MLGTDYPGNMVLKKPIQKLFFDESLRKKIGVTRPIGSIARTDWPFA